MGNSMKNVKNYFGEIFTGIVILGLVVYSFVGIGLAEQLSKDFWVVFAVNFSIMILITSIWYPSAKTKAQNQDQNYIAQRVAYGNLVNKIAETNNQKNLNSFCEWATEENRIFKIKQILIKINIDYPTYLSYQKRINDVDKDESLTKRQKRKLKKLIEFGVSVEKISYMKIMTGIKTKNTKYDTTSSEARYDAVKLSSKILISVVSSIFMGFIVFKMYGLSWESVAQLFTWIILIVWNIFTSYSAGYKSISIKRMEYYKKLKTFLEEFVSSEFFNRELNIIATENVSRETINETTEQPVNGE